ncbi:structural maintenance of chromosomes Smc2, partial [Kipferlia bialata]
DKAQELQDRIDKANAQKATLEASKEDDHTKALRAAADTCEETLAGAKGALESLVEEMKGLEKERGTLEDTLAQLHKDRDEAQEAVDAFTSAEAEGGVLAEYAKLERQRDTTMGAIEGLATGTVDGVPLAQAAKMAKKRHTDADKLRKAAKEGVVSCEASLESLETRLAASTPDAALIQEVSDAVSALTSAEEALATLETQRQEGGDVDMAPKANEASLLRDKEKLRRQIAQLDSRLPAALQDATFGQGVHGPVARLITVDPKYCGALEKTAGGRLFHVVADTLPIARAYMKSMPRRVTMVPMDVIRPNKPSKRLVSSVNQVSQGKARLAIELAGSEEELKKAVEYAFGCTVIADTLDLATKIAYNKDIHQKVVTVDGDVVSPHGTLSGGSKDTRQKQSILEMIADINDMNQRMEELDDSLAALAEAKANKAKADRDLRQARQSVTLMQEKVKLAEQRLKMSPRGLLSNQCTEMTDKLKQAQETLATREAECLERQEVADRLKAQADALKSGSGRTLEAAQEELVQLEKALKKLTKAKASAQRDKAAKQAQLESATHSIEESKASLSKLLEDISALTLQQNEARALCNRLSEQSMTAQAALDAETSRVSKTSGDLNSINRSLGHMTKEQQEMESARHKAKDTLKRNKESVQRIKAALKEVRQTNPSIKEWPSDGDVSMDGEDEESAEDMRQRLDTITEEIDTLSKGLDKHGSARYDQLAKSCSELNDKRAILKQDKDKIVEFIAEVNAKKVAALTELHGQVNTDLRRMFDKLITGAVANLTYIDEADITKGLQYEVRLPKTGQTGLDGLSGGQRSLLALSLVMALLKVRPAPVYILDEVDAALDLSHTQHIGELIKQEFNNSQFIVVSLKEGMWSNASVLYRTNVEMGVSNVTRFGNQD